MGCGAISKRGGLSGLPDQESTETLEYGVEGDPPTDEEEDADEESEEEDEEEEEDDEPEPIEEKKKKKKKKQSSDEEDVNNKKLLGLGPSLLSPMGCLFVCILLKGCSLR